MNKSGQFQAIGLFVQVIIAIIFWASGFAEQINYWTQRVILDKGLDGLLAFGLAYMNLWVFLSLMIVVSIGANVIGGGE